MNKINYEGLFNFLLEGSEINDEKKILVVFEDSRQKRNILDKLIYDLKNNPKFKINFNRPFLYKENFIKINNYYLYASVKPHIKIISPLFLSNTIYYYE